MSKEEWGVKRLCPETGKRFYDLNRDPIVSPYTNKIVEIDTPKSRVTDPIRSSKLDKETAKTDSTELDPDTVLDGDEGVDVGVDVDLEDELLEEDDSDNVSLDEISNLTTDDDE
ncbi:MAG: TIGR02300 family protein [Aestuariivita sp.]|nr:TIGR02300 family protein [Aestuariivita sp.]